MKDFSNFKLNKERIDEVKDLFARGENEAQSAFKVLVSYIYDELEAHRDGSKVAPRGLMAAMKQQMVIEGFGEKGTLSKSYLQPSFALASALHKGASTVIEAIWDDFLATGEDLEGSVTRGPLFTPSRLNAAWGNLNAKGDNCHFRADMEGIIAETSEGDRPWHTLNIADLKALNKSKDTGPKVVSTLMRVLGNPDNLEKKPGSLAKVVKTLRDDNEKLKSEVIGGFADRLDGIITDLRGDLAVSLAEAEVERAEQMKHEAQKKRLERAQNRAKAPIADQPQVGTEATSREEDPAEQETEEVEA